MSSSMQRTSRQLFRDCLRLVKHIAPGSTSSKSRAMKLMVRSEFAKHKDLTVEAEIETAKASAVRALANYMLYESGMKDKNLGKAMSKFHTDNIPSNNKSDPTKK